MNRTVRAELGFHHLVVTRHANNIHSVCSLACVTSHNRHERAQQREPDKMASVGMGHHVAVISADASLVNEMEMLSEPSLRGSSLDVSVRVAEKAPAGITTKFDTAL